MVTQHLFQHPRSSASNHKSKRMSSLYSSHNRYDLCHEDDGCRFTHDVLSLVYPVFGHSMTTSHDNVSPELPASTLDEKISALRSITDLQGLTDEELRWIATAGSDRLVKDGELIFRQGAPPHHLIFVLSGELVIRRHTSSPVSVLTGRTGRITGKTPFSRIQAWNADGRASGDVWLLEIHESRFPDLLIVIPSMTERMVRVLVDRNREYTKAEEQIGKLSALSKLAGNIAHELNNPASAARSAALRLSQKLAQDEEQARYRLGAFFKDSDSLQRHTAKFETIRKRVASRNPQPESTAAIFSSELEEAISAWLEQRNFSDSWKLAPPLAEAGVTVAQLEDLVSSLPPSAQQFVLCDLLTTIDRDGAVASILESCERIFRLVAAVKDYSYMDREPLQEVNIEESLDNVLAMFQPRLKNVTIKKAMELDLPRLKAFGSELNQAFAALVENALDAVGDKGTITLCAKRQGNTVLVEISDDGDGIAAEHMDRIFEPFFTTKPFGGGLGLGLDTVQRVVAKHFGTVSVDSKPHDTTFYVRLPLNRAEIY